MSRLAYDTVRDERDRLREQNDALLDHLTRMDRLDRGTSELPFEKRDPDPIPDDLLQVIMDWESSEIRAQLEDQARKARKDGRSWDDIKLDLVALVE